MEMPFTARLARTLDRETWVLEGDRLVCRLAFPTAEQRRTLTREPLLDRPEIELRIVLDETGISRISAKRLRIRSFDRSEVSYGPQVSGIGPIDADPAPK